VLLFLLELLLLLCHAFSKDFDKFVHCVGDAQDGKEENHKQVLACVLWGGCWDRRMAGPCTRWLLRNLRNSLCISPMLADKEVHEPVDKAKQAEDAPKHIVQLRKLVDDTGEGEEG